MARSTSKRTVQKAKRLRREMSKPEVMLWQLLRSKPAGYKFRRQHPVGLYVLDFYCAAAKLAIEIDGISHDMGVRPKRDEKREVWLQAQGLKVLRIPAREVLNDPEVAAEMIVAECSK